MGSRQGYQWIEWRTGKLDFCAAPDADAADLEQLRPVNRRVVHSFASEVVDAKYINPGFFRQTSESNTKSTSELVEIFPTFNVIHDSCWATRVREFG